MRSIHRSDHWDPPTRVCWLSLYNTIAHSSKDLSITRTFYLFSISNIFYLSLNLVDRFYHETRPIINVQFLLISYNCILFAESWIRLTRSYEIKVQPAEFQRMFPEAQDRKSGLCSVHWRLRAICMSALPARDVKCHSYSMPSLFPVLLALCLDVRHVRSPICAVKPLLQMSQKMVEGMRTFKRLRWRRSWSCWYFSLLYCQCHHCFRSQALLFQAHSPNRRSLPVPRSLPLSICHRWSGYVQTWHCCTHVLLFLFIECCAAATVIETSLVRW